MATDQHNRKEVLRAPSDRIRLVVSDVDGTLLTPEKEIAPSTRDAIRTLADAGVPVCLVSSRPAAGMEQFLGVTGKNLPYGSLNGAVVSGGDGRVLSSSVLAPETVRKVADVLSAHNIDQWFFSGRDWLVTDTGSPYVAREAHLTGVTPQKISSLDPWIEKIGKITGSSSDYALLEQVEAEIGPLLAKQAHAARSSAYYLDITPDGADKGFALKEIARLMNVPAEQVACLGDMMNDVAMMKVAGVAIAMGQASEAVSSHAHFQTTSNAENGWARAVTDYILPRVK